jgi:ribosomal protein S18 acetylase RimI-like enzyme
MLGKTICRRCRISVTEARRRGGARALVARAPTFARDTRAKGLVFETATDNLPAQSLYASLGWQRVIDFGTYSYDRAV